MKYKLILFSLLLVLTFSNFSSVEAYDHNTLESYISYRIKYIHNVAYNTNIRLSKQRAREYAREIIKWSDRYSKELGVSIDPLLVTAIIETETNFVSRSDYDEGMSIGVVSMDRRTAKWISDLVGEEYSKWRVLDATDLGIRLAVYYIGLGYRKYDNDLNKIIVSYNQGFGNASSKDVDILYNNYLFKAMGRLKYYRKRISYHGSSAQKHYDNLFLKLD
ncbi:transglycosylase SLT domain-containing protein [Halonatronum saccharophilum]|uniref:transglycosylase SLT domain-containing protein n=1 Tax=Halonatronum saccharophilum TaxID=150060 RepID=UPI000484CBDE|nr:transglycosylase SLT domain-containing protein [Halonatronum saccharophilum]